MQQFSLLLPALSYWAERARHASCHNAGMAGGATHTPPETEQADTQFQCLLNGSNYTHRLFSGVIWSLCLEQSGHEGTTGMAVTVLEMQDCISAANHLCVLPQLLGVCTCIPS